MEYYLNKYNCKSIGIEGRIHNNILKLFENKGNFIVLDGVEIMEKAKVIKNEYEIKCIKNGVNVINDAYQHMINNVEPNITENKLWSYYYQNIIENNCEYVETRLMSSGYKTNPWYQECSDKIINENEMIAFDSDTVGYNGYYIDFSRSFICPDINGNINITTKQKELFQLAYNQVQYNMNLIKPGVTFKEISDNAWKIPDIYVKNRYPIIIHGCGMTGEYPYIMHNCDWNEFGYDGIIQSNMILCVESFIGDENAEFEGVKYEEQILVTDHGYQILTQNIPIETYFFD